MDASSFEDLVFLKLGGSLITEKEHPHTHRPDTLTRLAKEIASARQARPTQALLLGHGSGSFGHVPAKKYGTRRGVRGKEGWQGFLEVWREAAQLNRLTISALEAAGLPAIAFPPSSALIARDGQVEHWDFAPIRSALQANLLPVVYGDVVFDRERGGTIFSTEELFFYLARFFHPRRILLAGIEPGVWQDYPRSEKLLHEITPATFPNLSAEIRGASAVDVTGGMASKVRQSLDLINQIPGLEVWIFSGEETGLVARALQGERTGTLIRSDA